MDTDRFLQQCAEDDQAELNDYMIDRTPNATADLGDSFFDRNTSDKNRRVAPFHVSTCLVWGCAKSGCTRTNGLYPCPVCKVGVYCSHEHQHLGRQNHRLACAKVKKIQKIFDKEHSCLLRQHGSDIFDETKALFCRVDTCKYSTACIALADTLLKSSNAHSVSLALDHLLKLLRLQRDDPWGLGNVIPALYLRLGQDQEAYNFCYWYASIEEEGDFDWLHNPGLFLDRQNVGPFGEIEVFAGPNINLSQIAAMTLFKIRLMLDLRSVHQARKVAGPFVPQEVLDVILEYVTFSSILSTSENATLADLGQHIALLREQIGVLYELVHKENSHFWSALLEPGSNLTARPSMYLLGDEGHMQLALQNIYNAWTESPGAIDVIRSYHDARSVT